MNYQKIYDQLIKKRQNFKLTKNKNDKNYVYCEEHHIIPHCCNGSDEKKNLVLLTAREHFLAHMLLCKIHECDENLSLYYKLCKAMTFFKCQSKDGKKRLKEIGQKINSRLYAKLAINARLAVSEQMSKYRGNLSHSYSRKWITNGIEQKFLKSNDAKEFLKNNPAWHYGQMFKHRVCSEQAKIARLNGMHNSQKYLAKHPNVAKLVCHKLM